MNRIADCADLDKILRYKTFHQGLCQCHKCAFSGLLKTQCYFIGTRKTGQIEHMFKLILDSAVRTFPFVCFVKYCPVCLWYTLESYHPYPSSEHKHCPYGEEQYFVLVRSVS